MNPLEQGGEPVAQQLAAGLTKIGLAIRNRCWKQAAGSGLTPTQGQILVVLGLRRQPSTLAEVAGALGITAPTASDALQALRRKRRANSPVAHGRPFSGPQFDGQREKAG